MNTIDIKTKNLDSKSMFFTVLKTLIVATILLLAFSCSDEKDCGYTNPIDDTFPFSCNTGMDVAFLIDYTGSMGEAIDGIKSSVNAIASTIVAESAGDYRLSLSIFDEQFQGSLPAYNGQADYTSLPATQKKVITTGSADQYLTMMETFATANQTTFSTQLAKLNSSSMLLGSGSGFAEPGGLLLDEVMNNNFAGTWRNSITKLVFIITDAPAGGDDDIDNATDDTFLNGLATQANTDNIQLVLVTTLTTGNYELELINNNILGDKLIVPDFNNIATNIITLIENICDVNEE